MTLRFWKDEYFWDKVRLADFKKDTKGKERIGPVKSLKRLKLQFLISAFSMIIIAVLSAYLANDSYQNDRESFSLLFSGFLIICPLISIFDLFLYFKINSVLSKATSESKILEDAK